MDWKVGLDYVVENCEYVSKLGAALETNNTIVKKQVFELLSALCSHNAEGYSKAIQTLEYYKKIKQERFSFKILVKELESTTAPEYQLTLISFINCVIASAPNFSDRFRIRNELIGLGILPILKKLRRESNGIDDIVTQLDVFDAQQKCDESLNLQAPEGINLNSHLDVFYAILGQVAGTPQETQFLSILQHLLRIDSKEAISDVVWKTAEKLVHRATLLESEDDSNHLLRPPSIQKLPCQNCRTSVTSPTRKQHPSISDLTETTSTPSQPPPPPPRQEPPPPPPPMTFTAVKNKPEAPKDTRDSSNETNDLKLLPQQEIPLPNSKMKTINWNKIPSNKVLGKWNIWAIVADTHQNNKDGLLDWEEMEGLFCLQSASNSQSNNLKQENNNTGSLDRKMRKEISEITLLDGKRNLNVNIFLKQFKSSNEEILRLIRNGQHHEIGAEKLRGFLKILPEFDEVDLLRSFDGDKSKLGNAEKFLIELQKVPNYKLRIECMLLKEEFAANITYLEPLISSILFAGEDLINNKALREILFMVVMAGNFLNAGRYAGNAAGVKLTSLQKLADIRANKTGINLIHYVAMQAEKLNPELLNFPSQLTNMENVSRTTIEQITNEINALDLRIRKIRDQINLESTEDDIRIQMTDFLLVAERQVSTLKRGMEDVEMIRIKLASFFCEDPATFKLEECFKIFHNFCERFKDAVKENERRRVLEEQAKIRRKQREEQMARRMKLNLQNFAYNSDAENNSELRMKDHLNNSEESLNAQNDRFSPEFRQFGSLRRPRHRVVTKEDEGSLMEFLKSSGDDSNPTRQIRSSSYGSLDRSWARKARSGTYARMRPGLRSIDFGENRERPNSPVSVVEDVTIVPEPPKPRVSREWRQKIENWLQGNKNEDKALDAAHRSRSRRLTNVSSLESNSEDRQKLDTLPEEKSATVSNDSSKRENHDWKTGNNVTNISITNIPAEEDNRPIFQRRNSSRNYNRLTIHTSLDSDRPMHSSFEESPRIEHQEINLSQSSDKLGNNTSKPPTNNYAGLNEYENQNIPKNSIYGRNIEISNIVTKSPDISIITSTCTPEINKRADPDIFHKEPLKQRNIETELYQRGFERVSGLRSPKFFNHSNDRVTVKEQKDDSIKEPQVEPTEINEESKVGVEEERVSKQDHLDESEKYKTYDAKSRKDSRRMSRINQEDVRKALRNLKSPTEKTEFMKGAMKSSIKEKTIKSSNPDFNDEGFEETQSFVSDTPSLGKEIHNLPGENSFPNMSLDTDSAKNKTIKKVLKYPSFGFSRSTIKNKPENIEKHRMTSASNRRNVERSSSRVSLQSSVSSLTSSHSTNTVRKVVNPSNKSLPKRRMSSIIPHNKSITSAKTKSSAPLSDLPPPGLSTNQAKIKRDSSSSSILARDSRFLKLRAKENATKISNPKELKTDVTFVNRFMRPTASSVTKRYDNQK